MDGLILRKLQLAIKDIITSKVIDYDAADKNVDTGHGADIHIDFSAPNKYFVDHITNETTINCYLISLHEDKERRFSSAAPRYKRDDKTYINKREPRFVELHYMITVWCADQAATAEIEHALLGYLISGLGGFDFLPNDFLVNNDIDTLGQSVNFKLFGSSQSNEVSSQIWQALGTTPKPTLLLSVSLPVDIDSGHDVRRVEKVIPETGENFTRIKI